MMEQQRGAVTPVMNMSLFLLLLLLGLPCSTSGLVREYHYINTVMSWAAAQSYCRERFTDLATVDSIDDVNQLLNIVDSGYSGAVWIGLKRRMLGHWVWSGGNETVLPYSAWNTGEPSGDGRCAYFRNNLWSNNLCINDLPFVCYNEDIGYIKKYVYKSWTDAQSYCRLYHTDLATIRSAAEQNQLYSVVGFGSFWIGLHFDFWQWSDQWSLFFRNWAAGYNFLGFGTGDCVAMSTLKSGKWTQNSCDEQHPFICYGKDKLVRKQIVRLNLSCAGECNLNDPVLQTVTLNEISEKLMSIGLGSYNNISWRKDEDGEMFHLESQDTANSTNK